MLQSRLLARSRSPVVPSVNVLVMVMAAILRGEGGEAGEQMWKREVEREAGEITVGRAKGEGRRGGGRAGSGVAQLGRRAEHAGAGLRYVTRAGRRPARKRLVEDCEIGERLRDWLKSARMEGGCRETVCRMERVQKQKHSCVVVQKQPPDWLMQAPAAPMSQRWPVRAHRGLRFSDRATSRIIASTPSAALCANLCAN